MGHGVRKSAEFSGPDRTVTGVGESERRLIKSENQISPPFGAIAQLGERIVRNDEVVGSIPTSSTIVSSTCRGKISAAHGLSGGLSRAPFRR